MTVCVAAICKDSEKIVVASDRMLTAGILSLEFEHTRPKIVELSDSCVMMTAGPALRDIELKKHVWKELAGMAGVAIPLIVEKVKDGYQKARRKKIEELYLNPRGLSLDRFLEQGQSLLPQVAMVIDEQLATYDYELEVLVAGVDSEGAHIYKIENPGTAECFDTIGYHAIGSGEPHAIYSLVDCGHIHGATLQQCMWSVFEAKKLAERAPGVGVRGDFAIIEQGSVIYFERATLTKLEELYKESQEAKANCLKDIKPKAASIPLPTGKGGHEKTKRTGSPSSERV